MYATIQVLYWNSKTVVETLKFVFVKGPMGRVIAI